MCISLTVGKGGGGGLQNQTIHFFRIFLYYYRCFLFYYYHY